MKRKKKRNPTEDVMKGALEREKWMASINNEVLRGTKTRLVRIHDFVEEIHPSKKMKNNTILHRLGAAGADEAMGLDYLLTGPEKQKIISIRRATDPELYYKLPSRVDEQEFVKTILNHVHFLILNPPGITRFAVVKGDQFEWKRSTSKGNRNRLYAIHKGGRHKVNLSRDIHWASIDKAHQGIPEFDFGPAFTPSKLSLREALLAIVEGDEV